MTTTGAPRRSVLIQRLAGGLAVVGLVVGCSAVPAESPGSGATPGPNATFAGSVSFDPNATFDPVALAEAVVNAGSDADRERAVVTALASIGLGVYTAEGEPIVSGAERTSTDFMVYDFEITGLAGGIKDGDDVFLDDIAQELSVMNVSAGGPAFTPVEFAAAVTTATAAAVASPDQSAGYALRLARELGLRRAVPVDLAAAPGAAPIVLDPLSGFLVAADVSLPRILGAEPPAVAAIGQFASVGDSDALLTAADPCTRFRRQNGSNWYAGMTSLPGSSGSNASFSRYLQARLIGGTVKFAGGYEHEWHHMHKEDQVEPKRYSAALQVRAQVPPRVNCGPIRFSGTQMQGGGQVVGADVTWTHPGLEHHGDINCSTTCLKTDARGLADLFVFPFEEPGPGGIGPEFKKTIPVTAEVNLFQALGPDLLGVLNLPPDMRVLARKEMPTEISWHRAYEIEVRIDSQLYVNKAPAYEYVNHVGTATAVGALDADTVHRPDDLAYLPPKIGTLLTITDQGQGPLCSASTTGAEGSITIKQNTDSIDFQVIDAVVYPPEELTLYLDVGPADDFRDDTYRLVQCNKGKIVSSSTSPGTNLWEAMIFRGYPRGLMFEGTAMDDGGPTTRTEEHAWNLRASQEDWEGDSAFVVAEWLTSQNCGGYCDSSKSWLNMTIVADPLPDP